MAEDFARKLPFSLEAEQAVLGSVLIDPERFTDIATSISEQDFYLEDHRSIFSAMQQLYLTNRTIDAVTLMDTLVHNGVYTTEQSNSYVKSIIDSTPSATNVKDYAKIVRDKSILRRLIDTCGEINDTAYAAQDEVSTIVDTAESKIFAIAQDKEQQGFSHVKDVLINVHEHLRLLREDKESTKGTPTGFSGVDKYLVGMNAGDLILVGARPGMGKTSFVMNIAVSAAHRTRKAVAVFSLEMSKEQLVSRMLSSEGSVDSYAIRSGDLNDEQYKRIAEASAHLAECDILIDDTTGISVTAMKAKLRRVKNLGLIVIDYLQLMQSDRRIDNRVQEVAEISRGLKLLAKELKVPLITCAQLSRAPESRNEKIPMLSDLRDSGAIEQDADVVMFLYRPDYYKDQQENQNIAEVIIAKNRHGSTGKVELAWLGQYTKFMTREEDMEAPDGV